MQTLEQKLKTFLETYKGEELSYPSLSAALKVSAGTLYNNKQKLEEAGIRLTHGNKSTKKRGTIVRESNLLSLSYSTSMFRVVLNHLNLSANIQVLYPGQKDSLYKVEGTISPKTAVAFLRKHLQSSTIGELERLNGAKVLANMLGASTRRPPKGDHSKIVKAFKDLYAITPEAEQVEAVYHMYKTLTKGDKGYVQALAGTSKTTCINVLKHYMKKEHGLDIHTTSYTQMASSELIGGTTLHSLLKKILRVDVIDTTDDDLHLLAEMQECLTDGVYKKPIQRLVIDECTTLTSGIILTAMTLAERIVFVGDKNQFENNSKFLGSRIGSLSKQYRFLGSETTLQKDITKAMLLKDEEQMQKLLEPFCVGTFIGKVKTRRASKGAENYTDYKDSFQNHTEILQGFQGDSDIVLAYSTNACSNINKLLNNGTNIKAGSKVSLKKAVYKPFYLPSGSFGKVLSVSGSKANVLFYDKGTYEVNVNILELAYAVTSLKSQGSAWDNVLYIEGTAPRKTQIEDMYVCVTRARKSIKVLSRTGVNTKELDIHNIYDLEEGQRNVMLYSALKGAQSIARASGLEDSEIAHVASSAFSTKLKTGLAKPEGVERLEPTGNSSVSVSESPEGAIPVKEKKDNMPAGKPVAIDNNWGYQAANHPTLEQMTKTKEQAQYMLDKSGEEGFITRNLKGGDIICIDCDCKEAVSHFEKYLDNTYSAISEDGSRAHLFFKVEDWYPTKHRKGLDFLGNVVNTRVNFKPNKVYNTKEIAPLTDEVLDAYNKYVEEVAL